MFRLIILLLALLLWAGFPSVALAQTTSDTPPAVSVNMRQQPLPKVLEAIEKQTGMQFSYESSLLKNLPKVTLVADKEPLESCLKRLFNPLPIQYQVSGNYIILKRKVKPVVISGFIRDRQSSSPLIGSSVFETNTQRGTAANNDGFFSIRLPAGAIALHFSYVGYESQQLSFSLLEKDTTLTVELKENNSLKEVVVIGGNQEKQQVLTTQMGAIELNQQTIRSTPTLFGEADIIKTLQLTPGVSPGAEGFTGMYVRGGDVDENLFLIDSNPVYQISHLGGIFSAFNPEAIQGMEFFKAGFPARYGGRLSSVVDVHTKEGNMRSFHGSASIGLIAGNVNLEGPIVKDKTSFMLSMRRTWLDALTAPALIIGNNAIKKDGEKVIARYAFHDINAKISHRFSERSRLFLSLYSGDDAFKGGNEEFSTAGSSTVYRNTNLAKMRWGNLLATTGWTYVFNQQLFGKIAAVYTQYHSTISQSQENSYGNKGTDEYEASFSEVKSETGIMDIGVRSSFDYLHSTSHHIRFGGDAFVHRFRPEYDEVKGVTSLETDTFQIGAKFANDELWAREFSVFAEDDWTISPAVRLNGGMRYTLFAIDNSSHMSLEPRLSARWLLRKNLSLKASYARMNQYVHLVSNNYINLPTDAWMPVTKRLKPQVSDQVSLGLYYNLKGEYDFSVEGYYKKLNNLLEYKDGYSFLPSFSSWEDKMAVGSGRAYGAELMVRKQAGKTTGWIGYTLSWADRTIPEINNGKRFPAKYDNRHKLNIVVQHKLSSKVELTGAWSYASGNRITLSLENYEGLLSEYYWKDGDRNMTLNYYDERNNYQLPAYHRLDLGINIYRPKKKGRMGIWNVSVYNVYNRLNPFMVDKSSKKVPITEFKPGEFETEKTVPCFKWYGIMPIIPSISYTYKF